MSDVMTGKPMHKAAKSDETKKANLSEVEAAIQAQRMLSDDHAEAVDRLIEYVEEHIFPFTLSEQGRKGIEKLSKKYGGAETVEAVGISAEKYLQYNSDDEPDRDSVETFIKKIGGILNLKGKPPSVQKVAYVKGICRNRFGYWNEWRGSQILNNYIVALRNNKYGEDDIVSDFDDEVIPQTKTCNNWSQWRGMMESWTEQIEGWAREREASQREQQASEHPNVESYESAPEPLEENLYIEEKRKGGANSYQAYKPLRDKVAELCVSELNRKGYTSANQLCAAVASIIESESPDLLDTFQPYKNHERDGNDWKRPTFYGWCNTHYKAYKA